MNRSIVDLTIPLVCTLAALLLLSALVPRDAFSQEEGTISVGPFEDDVEATSDSLSQVSRRARSPRSRRGFRWNYDLFTSGIYDSNVSRDSDELDGQGVATGAILRLNLRRRPTNLRLRYAGTLHTFSETERWNRISQNLSATIEQDLANAWTADFVVWASINALTVEFRRADLYTAMSRLEYSPSRSRRLRLFGAVRYKSYDDSESSDAFDPYIGADYRFRWRGWHYADIRVRAESNRADFDKRDFEAVEISARYTRPIGSEYRIRIGSRLRKWWFDSREVPTGGGAETELRRDWRWNTFATWIHDLPYSLRFQAEYGFDYRRSNDDERDIDIHRVEMTITYRFR